MADPLADLAHPAAAAPTSGDPLADLGPAPAAGPNPWQRIVGAVGKSLHNIEHSQERPLSALEWAANTPVGHAADAVLNAGSRVGTSAVAGRNPLKAIIDPASATEYTHGAEHNVLHNALRIPDIPESVWKNPWTGVPLRFGQVGLDLATETGLDPTMLIPGADIVSLARHVGRAGQRIGEAARTIPGFAKVAAKAKPATDAAANVADRVQHAVVEGHDLRKGVQRPGEDVVKGHEEAGQVAVRRQEQAYTDLVERHRPALEAIDQKRTGIRALLADVEPLAKIGDQKSIVRKNELEKQYAETIRAVPQEIKDAYNRRAYLEGTPQVRRQIMARGFKPTEEEAAEPVLNILHGLNEEYEPTQKIFKDRPEDLAYSGAPVKYVRQGRKLSADIRKTGSEPDAPLADRILDRLTTGARITNKHAVERKILRDVGLLPLPVANVQRVRAAIDAARAAGDTATAERLERLSQRQVASQEAAAQTRATHLKPGTEAEAQQKLEVLDPVTGSYRTAADMRRSGELSETTRIDPKTGKVIGLLKPWSSPRDVRFLKGKLVAGRRAQTDAEQFARLTEAAAARTAGAAQGAAARTEAAAGTKAAQQQAAARRLANAAIRTKAETADRVSDVFPKPASPLLDPEGHPIDVPRTANTFNDAKAVEPPAAPQPLIGGRQKRLPIAEARRRMNPPAEKPPSLTPAQGPIPGILDAAGNPVRKPTASERSQARILQPLDVLTSRIVRDADRKPNFESLINPSKGVAERIATAGEQAQGKVGRRAAQVFKRTSSVQARLASEEERNEAIEEIRRRAADTASDTNTVGMPAALKRRLFEQKAVYENALAKGFSDLQRDALFVIPLAHKKNLSVLAMMGPNGPKVISEGRKYAQQLKDDPTGLEARVRGLEQKGGSVHYYKDVDPVYSNFGAIGKKVGDFADKGNASLERYDLGLRLALDDELKRQGKVGFEAGGQIRDILGDPTNQAPFIRELRARYGANFPAWRLGVVPRAMTKALRENPKALQTYVKLERLLSDDITQPLFGADFDFGGPVEDYASMASGNPSFYTSQSTIGWPSILAAMVAARNRGQLGQEAVNQGLRVTPGGSMAESLSGFPFKSSVPWPIRGAAGLGGVYFPPGENRKRRANQLRRLGMKPGEIGAILNSEFPPRSVAPLPVASGADPLGDLR